MRYLILIFLCASSVLTAKVPSQIDSTKTIARVKPIQSDLWFGKDKFDHFCSSAFLTGIGYYGANKEMNKSISASRNIAVGFSLSFGVGKELYDKLSGKGTPSYKDIIADVLGTSIAFIIINSSSQ